MVNDYVVVGTTKEGFMVNDYEGPGRAKEGLDSTIITKTNNAASNVKTPPYTAFRFCFLFMSL